MPGVSRAVTTASATAVSSAISATGPNRPTSLQSTFSNTTSPRNTLASSSGIVVAYQDPQTPGPGAQPQPQGPAPTGLPFDEEAKLVFGVISSLRNMIKKLSGRCVFASCIFLLWLRWRCRDESFVSYKTSTYRMHLFETISGYKFIMLSDPNTDSMRFILRQIYAGPFIEYVVRNPLMDMDSKEHGIDNEHFRNAIDRLMRGLSVFA